MRSSPLLAFAVVVVTSCGGGRGGPLDGGRDGSGRMCGGFGGAACPITEFCDFATNSCGAADESGTCRPRPISCTNVFEPVCGCDGQIHDNRCVAEATGVDVRESNGCEHPGNFACGFRLCTLGEEFCRQVSSDVGGEPNVFSCERIPTACSGQQTCGCLLQNAVTCADLCTGDGASGLKVVCPGG